MNRWDEIQGLARNIASNVHADPAKRDAMADDLIKLCGAMINATGKVVAINGESSMNMGESDDADAAAYARYLVGERIQDAAREAVESATNPKVDLDRWTRPSPGDSCRCTHVPSVHEGGVCTGEQYNGEPCKGGPCTGFVRREPTGGWRHTDRRPDGLKYAAVKAAEADPFATPVAASRPCCSVGGPCATCRNGGPIGPCCFLLRDVCPSHH